MPAPLQIGNATLYHADCLKMLPGLVGLYEIVLTDPPYGIEYNSGWATNELWSGGNSIVGDRDCLIRDAAIELFTSPALVFGTRKRPVPLGTRMVLVWDKGAALGMGALDLPWKPSSEEIYVIGKGFKGSRNESNVLYCPPVQSMAINGRLHPNEKPTRLLSRLLEKSPSGVVLDPFMGSGSTGVAALAAKRKFIGIEINDQYFEIARKRIAEAQRQLSLGFICATA